MPAKVLSDRQKPLNLNLTSADSGTEEPVTATSHLMTEADSHRTSISTHVTTTHMHPPFSEKLPKEECFVQP